MTESAGSIALIGPGAIGGAIAGALVEAGVDSLICARSGFSDLTVDHPGGRIAQPVTCITDPAAVSKSADLVIIAVKAHQTEVAAPWLSALVGPNTTVVVAQNGVEHRERIRPLIVQPATVVPAVIWCPATRSDPGRIEVTGIARLTVPAGPGADVLAEALAGSFFEIRQSSDWLSRAWDKLLVNSALGGLGVLTGRSGAELCADHAVRDLLEKLMAEAVTVGRAEGANIPDGRADQILYNMAAAKLRHVSSIAVDRLAGLPTEWDARNQVIERLAGHHSIDVPLNRWLTALIRLGEPELSD